MYAVGCYVGDMAKSNSWYADGMVCISSSVRGLGKSLSICEQSSCYDIRFSVSDEEVSEVQTQTL